MDMKEYRICLDATPIIHGERAVKRNTNNLISALLSRRPKDYCLIYFDRKGNTPGRLNLGEHPGATEKVCRIPIRLLLPAWKLAGEPAFERLFGPTDLLYATDLHFPPTRKGKIISTIRGAAYLKEDLPIRPDHRKKLLRAFAFARANSDYFLAVSETTRQHLLECTDIPEDKIYVVTHGVDPGFMPMGKDTGRHIIKKRYNIDRPYLLFVGAVSRHKNSDGLISAFHAIAGTAKDLALVFAGPIEINIGKMLQIEKFTELRRRIHFLGPVEQGGDILNALYSASEMLVFPSFYEGWCAPPLEAMASGTPVVCSDIPAIREVAGDAAVYFDPYRTDDIAGCIATVLQDGERRARLVSGGLAHSALYTWDRAAEKLEHVFEEILLVL